MPLSSIGKMALASFANGVMSGTMTVGLMYFNWTMCVT